MTEGQRQLRGKGTQGQIALRLGVKQQTVSKWLNGSRKPDYASRKNAQSEYGIDPDAWDEVIASPRKT